MNNKSSYLLIMMLGVATFLVFSTAPATTQAQDNTIVIGIVSGQLAFNVTKINLDTNTNYTIIFVNNDAFGASHDLNIDVNGNLQSGGDVNDKADIRIGAEPSNPSAAAGAANGSKFWTGSYMTGGDGEVLYYCAFPGHYSSGMYGTFIVGAGKKSPGFELFTGIAALLMTVVAIPQIRKRRS